MKSKKFIFLLISILFIICIIFSIWYLKKNYFILPYSENVSYYQNGILLNSHTPDYTQDVKSIIDYDDYKKFINYPSGYTLNLPKDLSIDLNYSPAFVRIFNDNLDIKVSREYSPYKPGDKETPSDSDSGIEMYFRVYLNRFILNKEYQSANSIKIIEDKWETINGCKSRIISFSRNPGSGSQEKQNEYKFVYIITDTQEYYNFFFRTNSLETQKAAIDDILHSFTKIRPRGENEFNLDLKPILPKWNDETKAFYDKLVTSKNITWGYFYPWAITDAQAYKKVEDIENKLEYNFPIILHYRYIDHEFPMEGMLNAYSKNKVVELTMQVASLNNDNNPTHNANFDIIDGKYDDTIRKFAQQAKKFGHPFLFRLNNEMNTDWAQYSGVLLLSDPDIYIKVWQRIYDIFEQEGVNNAIWIFNPNSSSHPPTNWNSHVSYYSGNKYVHLLGVTGYNTGTYFKDVTGEQWKTFDEIYKPMAEQYRVVYSKFPWIITEFASNSVGGDKPQWIRDMFTSLPKYPEIKAAVWWSYFDPDYREGMNNVPARRYWLDETDECIKAFKEGLKGTGN